jgi:hypothetical protein
MENPISGSEETYNLMKRSDKTNARFLILKGGGMSSIDNPYMCTSVIINDFIFNGKLPPPIHCELAKGSFIF